MEQPRCERVLYDQGRLAYKNPLRCPDPANRCVVYSSSGEFEYSGMHHLCEEHYEFFKEGEQGEETDLNVSTWNSETSAYA